MSTSFAILPKLRLIQLEQFNPFDQSPGVASCCSRCFGGVQHYADLIGKNPRWFADQKPTIFQPTFPFLAQPSFPQNFTPKKIFRQGISPGIDNGNERTQPGTTLSWPEYFKEPPLRSPWLRMQNEFISV